VHYTIPFGLIASIVLPGPEERGAQRARVTLHSGEDLQLERTGDLGEGNAGMLILVDGHQRPEFHRGKIFQKRACHVWIAASLDPLVALRIE
jgi:hypothetical protein